MHCLFELLHKCAQQLNKNEQEISQITCIPPIFVRIASKVAIQFHFKLI